MNDKFITEICINRPNELWYEKNGQWQKQAIAELDKIKLDSLITAIASYSDNDISDTTPLLSATLPDKQRIQVVIPPACESGCVSITIRKPSKEIFSMDYLVESGFFDHAGGPNAEHNSGDEELNNLLKRKKNAEFLTRAVQLQKVIVVSGETGSGKTALMKTLILQIPKDQRIITIEDVPEIFLPNHENHVHLFYRSESKTDDSVNATTLLKSVMRMKPDRIILAEVRGGETFDFVNAAASGHGGSITSCHAGSCELTFKRMAMMMMQNPQGRSMPYDVIRELLHTVIDVVVHVHNDKKNGLGRHISEIWFKNNRADSRTKSGAENTKKYASEDQLHPA